MLKSINLEGFKSFVKEEIILSNLTVLTGVNSSGKSSVIQALRMFLSCNQLNSPYLVGYGGYNEIRSHHVLNGEEIIITVQATEDQKQILSLRKDDTWELNNQSQIPFSSINSEYIGADRHGPMAILPVKKHGENNITAGDRGQFCVDYFFSFENSIIIEKLLHPSTKSQVYSYQLNAWMQEIAPGTNLKFFKEQKHDISHVEIDGYRATNVGFGISYTLPIVMTALALAIKDTTKFTDQSKEFIWIINNLNNMPVLMIENPEAHLHPRGQTIIGKLLAMVAECGVQVIIETHSDHLLDGIRIHVKNKEISPDQVKIYYFEKDSNGVSNKIDIHMDDSGRLSNWPQGFFDQSIENLKALTK